MATPNSKALVEQIKDALVAKGQTFTTNCDAFQITARVAWALRSQGAQLFVKTPAQNGCVWNGVKYGLDTIAFPDGWVDILSSAGPPANTNGPQWDWHPGAPTGVLAPPFDLDAGTPPVVPPPSVPPSDPGVPPPVPTEIIAQLFLEMQAVRMNTEALMDALAKTRSDLADLRIQAAHGLTGSVFGYPITLKPGP